MTSNQAARHQFLQTWEARSVAELGDRIWLVLGGGGVRGVAHAGVWQAVVESGISIHGIVGTSIGALAGACIAGGMAWSELVRLGIGLKKEDIVRAKRGAVWVNGIRETSVFRGDVLRSYLQEVLPVDDWSQLDMPLQMNAVNLADGVVQWFGQGARTDVPLLNAVYASSALPVLYPPAEELGMVLVDGGTLDVLPIGRAAELGATGIIAVDVGSGPEADAASVVRHGMVAIHERVYSIMSGTRRREGVARWNGVPLMVLRPDVGRHSAFDFERLELFVDEGYRATRTALEAGGSP